MKNIVLFDMDGTLTEPRKKIDRKIAMALHGLSQHTDVGIVTGSGLDYVLEQCSILWDKPEFFIGDKITLLPCNGTMAYTWQDNKWRMIFSRSIRQFLGKERFRTLMKVLSGFHYNMLIRWENSFPLTGHYISLRSSLVNLCPCGRNALDADREAFIKFDNLTECRKIEVEKLKNEFRINGLNDLSVTLGGSTSFDIYPIGWDKTFSLSHYTGHRQWFVGDRCEGYGNDRSIYELLAKENQAFKTTGPEKTIEIIEGLIKILKKGDDNVR